LVASKTFNAFVGYPVIDVFSRLPKISRHKPALGAGARLYRRGAYTICVKQDLPHRRLVMRFMHVLLYCS